jgi:pyruvate/2-oxoglutarate/acetoin dehydrogenase E1 component
MKNSSSDISPTAGQMPRLLGLAFASKLYRNNKGLGEFKDFSINGNEVAFGTIGNASTSEGHFFETMNAAGVLQVPLVLGIWDDGYGISVPARFHTIKQSISKALLGFQKEKDTNGFEIFTVRGWQYPELVKAFQDAASLARKKHIPCLVHVIEMTQPQGHSTSGSHERYKSKERLSWESDHDCISKMRDWILEQKYATIEELESIVADAKLAAKKGREAAWRAYIEELKQDKKIVLGLLHDVIDSSQQKIQLTGIYSELKDNPTPLKADILKACRTASWHLGKNQTESKFELKQWLSKKQNQHLEEYSSHVHSESDNAAVKIAGIKPTYNKNPRWVDGREVLNACFDHHLSANPLVFAFGEDVGKIGDVNQGFAGLQQKHGEWKVMDTGIRETSIIGQGIGAALRGLRPIAEIQYLDYLLYAIQTLSDDLATLHHRTKGGQKAPLIIRTRGHRLEGVWHSGSPMSMILGALRGIYVLVPRNMTQAAGFYNTMLASDDPAIIIESLNGYRLKEKIPNNLEDFRTPIGIPEIINQGTDITVVTYGSMCRIVMDAAQELDEFSISVEVIDVQTLLPFDTNGIILESLKKTGNIIFIDEDVPGGASAYMMQKVLERDGGYQWLDSKPVTLTAKEHRPAYGSDGDYFSKPNVHDVFESIYAIMNERDPKRYPDI